MAKLLYEVQCDCGGSTFRFIRPMTSNHCKLFIECTVCGAQTYYVNDYNLEEIKNEEIDTAD